MEQTAKQVQIIKPSSFFGAERIRVAAYCRVSTSKDDQVNSFLAQMKYYNDYINMRDDMELIDIYADEGITGTSIAKRDEFKRLLKDCSNRKIDRVLVKSVTRFARNSLECIEAVRQLKENGVTILFENDNIDTASMSSEMILYIKSAFAQGESISASKRMSTSLRMKMEDGSFIATQAPFGYRLQDKRLVVIEEEAVIIKEIFSMYLQGCGVSVIAKILNSKYPSTKNFSSTTIQYILDNEKYIGDSMWQKTYTPQQFPLRSKTNNGEKAKYYCENTQEAIISKEDFIKVKELRLKRKDKFCKENEVAKITRGAFYKKIICRNCGWTYREKTVEGSKVYTCSKKGNTLQKCSAETYCEDEIKEAFVRIYNKFRANEKLVLDETIAQLQSLKAKRNNNNKQITEIDYQIARLGQENITHTELYNESIIDEVLYVEKTDAIKREITELKAQRFKLINEDDEEKCIEQLRELKRTLNDSEKEIISFDKYLFEKIISKIYVENDSVLTFVFIGELELKIIARRKYGK